MSHEVLIIGGGPAGLAAAKAMLECGLTPIVLEKQADLGGLWNPRTGAMWDSMRTNLSRHSCQFSDFPWPEGSDDFPRHDAVQNYLRAYAEHFDLHQHIRFNSDAQSLRQHTDGWHALWQQDEQVQERTFKNAVVASGFFSAPYIPTIDGAKNFQGESRHSHDYRSPDIFKGKSVLIIGNAFSGTEIAADIASSARHVTHTFRHPVWILPRYFPSDHNGHKIPLDLSFYSRAGCDATKDMERAERNKLTHTFFAKACGNPGQHNESLHIDDQSDEPAHVAISDQYLSFVDSGLITPKKSAPHRIQAHGVVFEDGSRADVDVILYATGYNLRLPFFDAQTKAALDFDDEDRFHPLPFHKGTFHPALPGVAFAGVYRGPYFGIMELQARWAAQVFIGAIAAPSYETQQQGVAAECALRDISPRPQFPHGDYVGFAESLAAEIGVKPEIKTGDALHDSLWYGPFIPAHHRLQGPGSQPQLAKAMINSVAYTLR